MMKFRNVQNIIKYLQVHVYNASLGSDIFPDILKTTTVTPLYKNG
jgi:hypothetical protein